MTTSVPMQGIIDKSRTMLGLRLYVIRTTPTGDLDDVIKNVPEHLAYQIEIEKRGILFAAGPVWQEESGEWRGEGLVVVRAKNQMEAEEIANADPMHKCGARRFSIEPWLINEGGFKLAVSFSDQKFAIQ